MSTASVHNPQDGDVSEKGHEIAVPVHVKIQQAQDLIKQMNEKLSFTLVKFEKKQIAYDRNGKRLADLRWEEQWNQWRAMSRYYIYCAPFHCNEGNYKYDLHSTVEEQDELIRKMRYKLLHKTNTLAEEKKLIKQIKEAKDIRETMATNPKPKVHRNIDTNATQVYKAKQLKKKYEKKVLEEFDYARRKLRSLEENRIRMNEKKRRVHRIIYDLVKQQEQVIESHQMENTASTTDC